MIKRNKILFVISFIFMFLAVISFGAYETNFIFDESLNKEIYIKVLIDDTVKEIELEEYIVGVLAGEMPASFEEEALKAQSVASRSYAIYKINSEKSYDVTDTSDDQVYLTTYDMREKWGDDFQKYYAKIKNAVSDTKGIVATYEGDVIEAFYFSMSSGSTQNSEEVFGEKLEYLQKVESEYDNENLNNYAVSITYTKEEFKNILGLSCDELDYNIVKNDSNYVKEISICDKNFTGTNFRTLLNLRSASFDIEVGDEVIVTTYGYGHGVGMSQYGANGYAKAGLTYEEILKHYYQDIELINIYDV